MQLNNGSQGFRLLTPGNPKTEKGRGLGYWMFILHLAPAKLSGFNVCPMATAGCKRACLNTAGRGGISRGGILTYRDVTRGIRNEIQNARRLRTRAFFEHRAEFMALLAFEIAKACCFRRATEIAGVPCWLIKRFGSVDSKDRVGKRRPGDTGQTAVSFSSMLTRAVSKPSDSRGD